MSWFVRASRLSVVTGTASRPCGSQRATPTRTVPTSTPNQIPSGSTTGEGGPRRGEGVTELGDVAAGSLREIGLAATTRAEHRREGLHECARLEPGRLPGVVDGSDERDSPAVVRRGQEHDRRVTVTQPAADVERER